MILIEEMQTFQTELLPLIHKQLLHALLPPAGHIRNKLTKEDWKISISDSQNSFIIRIGNGTGYNDVILHRRER